MTKYLLVFSIFLLYLETSAQTYNMSNNSVTNTSGTLHDSGGPLFNYGNNQNLVFTICPTGASCIALNFSSFALQNGPDVLSIYNGNSTSGALLGSFTGANSPGTLFITGSCVTLNFTSNNNTVAAGWTMTWQGQTSCSNLQVQTGGNNSNASWLVPNIFLTGCSQVSNVTYTGSNQAIGYFTNGAGIGLASGIILATGNATNAIGPNNATGVTTNLGTAGDPDLTALTAFTPCGSASTTLDAAVLTFNFVPLSSTVEFRYVFASDEYLEYVCSSFNDVFGFFISGPGITGQQNIATVPGTNTYVGINTVNNVNNSAYYINNPSGSQITQYDGFTTVMTATATGLTPCQTYTIKLAVADAGDRILDSAVFLGANSFNAGNAINVSAFVPSTGTLDAYEGCQDGYFQFTRGDLTDLSQPINFTITVTGTATPGVDYEPLTLTVTIPPGEISVTLPVIAYQDFIFEGSESIIVQINELQCNCTLPPPAQLNIFDTPEPFTAFISNPPVICPPGSALIAVIAQGSQFTPYTYAWSNGGIGPAISVSPAVSTTYSVTVTDGCGRTTTTSIPVTVSTAAPSAAITPAGPFCQTSAPVTLVAASGGGTWSGPGVTPATGVFDPAAAFASGPGPYTISYFVSNSCGSSTASTTIIVNPNAAPVINPFTPPCVGSTSLITLTSNIAGGTWSGPGIVGGSNTTGQWSPVLASGSGAGPYTITYNSPPPCGGTTSTTIAFALVPTATITGNTALCSGQSTTLTASGGGTYQWNTGATSASITVNPSSNTTYNVTVTSTGGCTASSTVTVAVSASPIASINNPTPICAGQNVTLTATGGGTYAWSSGQNTASITISPTSTTTYIVTVTNAAGCTATASRTVTVNPQPTASVNSVSPICSGQSVTLTVTGTGTYTWNTGATSASITVNPTANTTYIVTVTGAGGCTATASSAVTVNPQPTASAGAPQSICAGQSATLTATGGGTYAWSSGQSTASITVSPAATTTYIVTVTGTGGCTATASNTVTVNPIPTAGLNPPQTVCSGTNVTLTATGGGSYFWNTGATSATISVSPTATTTYTVTVTGTGNCTASASTTITVSPNPTANAGPNQTICAGNSITMVATGAGAGGSYSWSNGVTTASNTVSPTATTTYTVTVTNAAGCTASASKIITVNPIPNANAGPNQTICAGQSVTMTATGGGTYLWNTGATTATTTVSPASTTTYIVTVTGAGGCTASASRTITVNPAPIPSITAPPTICVGGSISLTASGGITYTWSTGATTATINVSPASTTTYTVTVTGTGGCTATTSTTVTVNPPTPPSINPPAPICAGQSASLTATGGGTYLWNTGATTASISVSPASTTNYTVTVTDTGGCTGNGNGESQPDSGSKHTLPDMCRTKRQFNRHRRRHLFVEYRRNYGKHQCQPCYYHYLYRYSNQC